MDNLILVNGLYCCVDWLEFTITKPVKNCDNIRSEVYYWLEYLGLNPDVFDECGKGGIGYKCSLKHMFESIFVFFDGAEDMGIHIRVTGSAINYALESFKSLFSSDTPFGVAYDVEDSELLSNLLSAYVKKIVSVGHFTRIDIAIDDIGANYYTVSKVASLAKNGNILTKFKKWEEIKGSGFSDKSFGHTVYFGSRKSDLFLRVYEKGLEQDLELPWTRWELEIKHEKAVAVSMLLSSLDCNLGKVGVGILSECMRVIRLDNNRRSRCSFDDVWLSFIYNCEKIPLRLERIKKTIDDKMIWIQKQCMPTIAGLIVANGGDISFLRDNLEMHFNRLNGHDKLMYLEELGG